MPRRSLPGQWTERDDPFAGILSDSTTEEVAEMDVRDRKALEADLKGLDAAFFRETCRRAALEELPKHLDSFCTDESRGFDKDRRVGQPWYFDNVPSAVIEMMDRWAVRVKQRIAETAVTKQVFESLDETAATRILTMIRGSSRFGKTEGLRAYCDAHPGRSRFVAVPSSNSMRDFFTRIAEALGIDTSYGASVGRLRSKIAYVLTHTELFLCFDEGAWLLPQNYSTTTAPARMNWLRSELFDRGLPVAIAVTPQWYDGSPQRFVDKTGYAIEQFNGRREIVDLPEILDQSDLVRVAAHRFPEIKKQSQLTEIASYAPDSENYLQVIERIEKRARYMAERDGMPLTMEVVRRAIQKTFPSKTGEPRPDGAAVVKDSLQVSLSPSERQVQPIFRDGEEGGFEQRIRRPGLERIATGAESVAT